MEIFLIAILISIVLRFLSSAVIKLYVMMDKSTEELSKSFLFNIAVLTYVLNNGLLIINGSILSALIIKTYLL